MPEAIDGTEYSSCPICSSAVRRWRIKRDPSGSFRIDRCVRCGYGFVNPRPTSEFLKSYYSASGHGHTEGPRQTLDSVLEREAKSPNSTLDAKSMIASIRSLQEHGDPRPPKKLLDVGCGYGFFSREALAAGFETISLECASVERGIAAQMNGIEPIDSTFEQIDLEEGSLSVVLMSQILEHANDVNLWIEKARRLLLKGGILAIALPNFGSLLRMVLKERHPYVCPPAHLNFFSAGNLSHLLERNGFTVERVEWVSRLPLSAFEKRVPMLGERGLRGIGSISRLALHAIDKLQLGETVRVYARRT